MLKKLCLGAATALGLAALANGGFMLISPDDWYTAVPGVIPTGPFNQHFIRDIGLIFTLLGAGLLMGVARPDLRSLLWTAVAVWLGGHALFHVWEVLAGICGPSALVRDFAAVSLPAIITCALAIWAARQAPRQPRR